MFSLFFYKTAPGPDICHHVMKNASLAYEEIHHCVYVVEHIHHGLKSAEMMFGVKLAGLIPFLYTWDQISIFQDGLSFPL